MHMSVDDKLHALEARVAALEARLPSPGAMRLHGPILPPPMPAHVAGDPDGWLRAETRRKRKTGLTWDAIWDNHDLDVVQRGMGLFAHRNKLRSHGYRDFIETPLREEERLAREAAA